MRRKSFLKGVLFAVSLGMLCGDAPVSVPLDQIAALLRPTFVTPQQVAMAVPPAPPVQYTIATLPVCSAATAGRTAYVTDLGGGADNVSCRGTVGATAGYWGHIRFGQPAAIASCDSVTITPLASAPVENLTCSTFQLGFSVTVVPNNLYPGEEFYINTPSTLGGVITTIGVNIQNAPSNSAINMTAGKSYHLIYDGTKLQQLGS